MTTRSNTAPLRRSRNSSKRRMRIIRAKCRVLSPLVPQLLEGATTKTGGRELGSICKIGLRSFMNWRKTRLLLESELESAKTCKRLSALDELRR